MTEPIRALHQLWRIVFGSFVSFSIGPWDESVWCGMSSWDSGRRTD